MNRTKISGVVAIVLVTAMVATPAWAAPAKPVGPPVAAPAPAGKTLAGPSATSISAGASKNRGGLGVKGQARELRDRGIVAVNLGRYEDAVHLLEQAYELSREPSILFDLVQAHRLHGNPERALILCASFLRTAPALSPRNREQIERTVAELGIIVEEIQLRGRRGKIVHAPKSVASDEKVAAEPVATEPEPARPPEDGLAEVAREKQEPKLAVVPAQLPSAASVAIASDRSANLLGVEARAMESTAARPFYRKPWFWTAAGVVAVGIVAAIVYQSSRDPGPPRTSWGSQRVF